MMTSSSIRNGALSGFTLSLLKDSGWYAVDLTRAEPMFWGEGLGEEFLTKTCHGDTKFREYCYDYDTS